MNTPSVQTNIHLKVKNSVCRLLHAEHNVLAFGPIQCCVSLSLAPVHLRFSQHLIFLCLLP